MPLTPKQFNLLATKTDLKDLKKEMSSDLKDLENRMASKEDLKDLKKEMSSDLKDLENRMASKEDLKDLENRMASKEDLKDLENRMASKMATKEDLNKLADKTDRLENNLNKLNDKTDKIVISLINTQENLKDLRENMADKKDIHKVLNAVDSVVKRLDNIEHDFVSNLAAHDRFEKRITRVEKHLELKTIF